MELDVGCESHASFTDVVPFSWQGAVLLALV